MFLLFASFLVCVCVFLGGVRGMWGQSEVVFFCVCCLMVFFWSFVFFAFDLKLFVGGI